MQFSQPSPGLLVPQPGTFLGTWQLGSVVGITVSQAEGWITSSLNDPRGWGRAGCSFQQASGGRVLVSVIEEITGPNLGPGVIGLCTHYSDGSCIVLLETAQYPNADVVNHEMAHAYFFAEHSPEGSDSVEEPADEPGDEWPSDLDIAQVQAWLGNPPPVPPPEPQRYFFPGDLDSYITPWRIPAGARSRMTATVIDPAPAIIRPVYAQSHAQMLSGDRHVLTRGIGTDVAGFHRTEWRDAAGSGDLFVALMVEAEPGVSMDDLNIAHAEVQISGTGDDSSRSIVN